LQSRIDYVYFLGEKLAAVESRMIDDHADGWPSDHAAVFASLRLGGR
jgi:endonuclease/exonuclease/phosphatase family metal-dependent hydrolase